MRRLPIVGAGDLSGRLSRLLSSPGALRNGFIAAGVLAVLTLWLAVWQQGDDVRLRQSLHFQVALSDLFSSLQDEQIGERGYLLTGDTEFLRPFERARVQISRQLLPLEDAVKQNRRQAGNYSELRTLAINMDRELAEAVEARRQGHALTGSSLARAHQDQRTMDEVRRLIEAMDAAEDDLVTQRQTRLRHATFLTLLATAALIAVMGVLALAALREARRRASLARYVPGEIAPLLADEVAELRRGVQRRLAIAFVDMRGSTELAERIDPVEFMLVLSEMRGAITGAAQQASGVIDKFIGDGAMVMFGLGETRDSAASNALSFARNLLDRLAEGCGAAREPIAVGIGLHYGEVFCGVVGDDNRREFTALGDTVNVAARLETRCKELGVPLVVSEATLIAAGEDLGSWVAVDLSQLPGRSAPVRAYVTSETDTGSHL